MKLTLQREAAASGAILGTLSIDGERFCVTLENADMAIPIGHYVITCTYSPKFGEDRPLVCVPGREGIRFHSGNSATDSEGCILLGDQRVDGSHISGGLRDGVVTRFDQLVMPQLPASLEVKSA